MDWVENGLIRTCPYSEGAQEELLEVLSKRVTWSAVTTARLIFLKLQNRLQEDLGGSKEISNEGGFCSNQVRDDSSWDRADSRGRSEK